LTPFKLRQLTALLESGAVIAYPTETVWGLGCLPNHHAALQHLADIKQRPINKGFILLSPNIEYCLPYVAPQFHSLAVQNIKLNVKRPTTWLVPKSNKASHLISGQFNTVAIRITAHPFINQICHALKTPFISTSANIHSRPSLNSALLVNRFLGGKVSRIIYGYENGSGQASSIIHLESQKTIRQ